MDECLPLLILRIISKMGRLIGNKGLSHHWSFTLQVLRHNLKTQLFLMHNKDAFMWTQINIKTTKHKAMVMQKKTIKRCHWLVGVFCSGSLTLVHIGSLRLYDPRAGQVLESALTLLSQGLITSSKGHCSTKPFWSPRCWTWFFGIIGFGGCYKWP